MATGSVASRPASASAPAALWPAVSLSRPAGFCVTVRGLVGVSSLAALALAVAEVREQACLQEAQGYFGGRA